MSSSSTSINHSSSTSTTTTTTTTNKATTGHGATSTMRQTTTAGSAGNTTRGKPSATATANKSAAATTAMTMAAATTGAAAAAVSKPEGAATTPTPPLATPPMTSPPPPPSAATTTTTTSASAAAVSAALQRHATAAAATTRRARSTTRLARSWCAQHKRSLLLAGVAVSAYVALRGSLVVVRLLRQARMAAFLRSLERDVVHLFVHPRWSHGPNLFPACVLVEAFLRLAHIPYIAHFTNDSTMSPNGRLPFIVHNGTALADSDFVVQYLSTHFAVTLDRALTSQARAKGVFVRHLIETSLHYGLMRATFVDHPAFMTRVFADEFALDPLVARVVVRGIRSMTVAQLNAIGYGNLRQELYEAQLMRDVRAVETLIGEGGAGAYVCGSRTPSTYDCAVYAWMHICIELGACGNAALAYAASSRVLRDYVQRMSNIAFPDAAHLHTSAATQRFTEPHHASPHATSAATHMTIRTKRAA